MWLLRFGRRNSWLTEKLEPLPEAPLAETDLTPDEEDKGTLSLFYVTSIEEARFVGVAFILIYLTSLPKDFLLLPLEAFAPLKPYPDPVDKLPPMLKDRHWGVKGLIERSSRIALADRARNHPKFSVERLGKPQFYELAPQMRVKEVEVWALTREIWKQKLTSYSRDDSALGPG